MRPRDVYAASHEAAEATVARTIGPFQVHTTLQIQVIERTAPTSIILIVSGRDLRLKSEFSQKVDIQIRDEHGSTFINIRTAVRVGGLLSKLSRYLIEMQIKQLLNDFPDNFGAELGRRNASLLLL